MGRRMTTWTYDYSRKGRIGTSIGHIRATTETSAKNKAKVKHGKGYHIFNVHRR